ncbi:MAG: SpoIIE family protein phosphatase [Verrucomicrobiota bacterium]
MTDGPTFFDIHPISLHRQGEELCGDQVKVLRAPDRTIVVLSDGLGSGVKANILARLTSEIILTMIRANAALQDVIETVVGTLPSCKVRRIAYATFIVIEIRHNTGQFKVINFDSPNAIFLKRGRLQSLEHRTEYVQGKVLSIAEGVLDRGDFLGIISDGMLYAGMPNLYNFGWGWDGIARYLEGVAHTQRDSAEDIVKHTMAHAQELYGQQVGDDATLVGVLARQAHRLMIFTGPPVDPATDATHVESLLNFTGRRVLCGGTTGNIVAKHLGKDIELELDTVRPDVPPIGKLPGVDLLTEGILTLAKTLALLQECRGQVERLPEDRNGAVLLARELLEADSIFFLAGERVNAFYQNPLLPRSVSIRRSVLTQIVELLNNYHKEVKVTWC